jgi:hypothetical protein
MAMWLILAVASGATSLAPVSRAQEDAAAIERLGGAVFRRDGRVVEVNLNRVRLSDGDLALLSRFTAMTDLSLEETQVGDEALKSLAPLKELRWLNLYRTRIGDAGLAHLRLLERSREKLYIHRTDMTIGGVRELKRRLPRCEIYYRSDREAE